MSGDAGNFIVVMTTCGSAEEAERLASELIDKKLAACVQASHIISTYRWQGTVERAEEVRLMIKARSVDYGAIEESLRQTHSYANPEIVALPVAAGAQAYLDWIAEETRRD